jgi:tripartite ATP-independent transporter DctM subunit
MEPVQVGIIAFAVLFILICLGVPVGFAMMIPGTVGLIYLMGFTATAELIVSHTFRYATNLSFTALPMFLIMGYIVVQSGLMSKSYDFAKTWLSRLPAPLAMASCVASAIFGACCGSGLAATAAMGQLAVPEMIRRGYDPKLASGSVASASGVAVLIPPSVVMVIFSVFSECSLGRLLLAGYLPGVLSMIMYMLVIYIWVRLKPAMVRSDVREVFTWKQRWVSLKGTWGIVLLMGILLVGVYCGVFTATEAAAVSAFTAFVLMAIVGKFKWPLIRDGFSDALRISGMTFILMLGALIFAIFLGVTGIPTLISSFIANAHIPVVGFIILSIILFLILGCFMPSTSMLLLTMPVLLPVVSQLNIDLIWYGIIYIKMAEVGAITPPFGISVFVLKSVMGKEIPISTIFKGIFWFFVGEMTTTAILVAFPVISLWLPNTMRGG